MVNLGTVAVALGVCLYRLSHSILMRASIRTTPNPMQAIAWEHEFVARGGFAVAHNGWLNAVVSECYDYDG